MVNPEINRLDLNILMVLAKDNAIDELSGMTINEIKKTIKAIKNPTKILK